MFGNKKKQQKLSPKVSKADKLRETANRYDGKLDAILTEWTEKLHQAKSVHERETIDKKYGEQAKACEKMADKTYANYYNYVDDNFRKSDILIAGAKEGKFMDKSFIKNLEKLTRKSKKR